MGQASAADKLASDDELHVSHIVAKFLFDIVKFYLTLVLLVVIKGTNPLSGVN